MRYMIFLAHLTYDGRKCRWSPLKPQDTQNDDLHSPSSNTVIINRFHNCLFFLFFLFSETWKDNPDFALYLAELSASSLEKLSRLYKYRFLVHAVMECLSGCVDNEDLGKN